MSTITCLLDRGSGPSQMRTRLAAETRAIRRAAARLSTQRTQTTRLVHAKLPAAVMGGDLLNILSQPVRALLRDAKPAEEAYEQATRTVPRFGSRAEPRAPRSALLASNTPGERRTGEDTAAPGWWAPVRRTQASFSAPGREPASRGHRQTGLQPTEPGRAVSAADDGPEGIPKRTAGPQRADVSVPGQPRGRTILERSLEEYFRSAREAGTPGTLSGAAPDPSTIGGAAPSPPSGRVPNLMPGAPPTPVHGATRPALNEEQVAERLQAFLPGGLPPEAGGVHRVPAEGGRVEVDHTFDSHVAGAGERRPSMLRELSDQVTEILHQQAIQHGIDVT
jgi:hypothetical protein